ncbi:MAG: hypothetical protein R6U96_01305 [Promethearchaeia archaeon]
MTPAAPIDLNTAAPSKRVGRKKKLNVKYKIQNTKYKIQNTKYKIQNTKYKIPNKKKECEESSNETRTRHRAPPPAHPQPLLHLKRGIENRVLREGVGNRRRSLTYYP